MAISRRVLSMTFFATRRSCPQASYYLPLAQSSTSCACRHPASLQVSTFSKNNVLHSRLGRPSLSLRAFSSTHLTNSSSPFRLSSTERHGNTRDAPSPHGKYAEDLPVEEEEEYYSPHQPKRQWPPNMSKLSPKHQLRLERKYRRRAALKYARPRWVKATKLIQWGVIIFVVIYSVLFMKWDKEGEEHPFENFRKEFFGMFNSIISTPKPPGRKTDNQESK
ncbi:hypothetical protein BGW36DRAFT_171733 [Talaromyces proteolyticus]|uniref:Transmembrane protein n=1 Tax=Talaromyces proteolyticus TaxID=1131652 RepID=A0AAD4KRM7_9EURO|nr:uncharacterized protein BGW36DRAFT_171733 [Talaromyces proteolyticus]KAH8697646.1 hypothetical protein BGW36DRAFT_171733 [Talaromyces proteolyticus]